MRALGEMTRVELKLFAREPLTVLFVLVLPVVVLYVLNGVFGSQPPNPTVWEGLGPSTSTPRPTSRSSRALSACSRCLCTWPGTGNRESFAGSARQPSLRRLWSARTS